MTYDADAMTTRATEVEEAPALFTRIGHVGVVTLNRPRAMNAVNSAMSIAVEEALAELREDPELRVGVITGAGDSFCSGADLKEVAAGRSLIGRHQRESGFGGFTRRLFPKPLVAAVNGFALGGGTEIMMACDLAVAAEDAVLGLPEVRHGVLAAEGGVLRLADRIPQAIALEWILTGAKVDATTALKWGLVNRVVGREKVLDTAVELAEAIARNAPLAVQASKRVVQSRHDHGSTWEAEAWAVSDAEIMALTRTEDFREGPRAFAEKRRPVWSGR